MPQHIAQIALVVRDYDEALQYYTSVLNFELIEDTTLSDTKRWVVVQPKGSNNGCKLLLAKAASPIQEQAIGNQTGGRVFLFLHTNDFDRDYQDYTKKGVVFVRPPVVEPYGKVAVFKDHFGNLWDLIQPKNS